MTALTCITNALLEIGRAAAGEPIPNDRVQFCLGVLNRMMSRFQTMRLLIPQVIGTVYPLVAGTGSYTIGPGGNFNQVRPLWIPNANLVLGYTNPVLDKPLNPMTDEDYALLGFKTATSPLPTDFYYNRAFPQTGASAGLGTFILNPYPSGALAPLSVRIFTPTPFVQFANLATDYQFPPGYEEAITLQLAIRLATPLGVKSADIPLTLANATTAMGDLKRANYSPRRSKGDRAIASQGGGFNARTGGYGRSGR